jgi:hypothetical protein
MPKRGHYFAQKSVNKSEVTRKTRLSKSRLSELTLNPSAKLRADELYFIALAIDAKPGNLFSDLTLKK